MKINQGDLKFFTAHALQGLLANPLYSSVEGQRYLNLKKLTIEALAVRSALETMENLEKMNDALNQAEENLAEAKTATDNMVPINDNPKEEKRGRYRADKIAGNESSSGSESVSGR